MFTYLLVIVILHLTVYYYSGLLSWSKDSHYICTRNDSMPNAVWIWEMRDLEVAAILIHKDPVRAAAWDPTCTRLVLCTGSSHLYMWTPSGAYCVSVPLPQFSVTDLKWNSDGSCLLLKDKDSFCCAAVPPLVADESSDYSSDDWLKQSLLYIYWLQVCLCVQVSVTVYLMKSLCVCSTLLFCFTFIHDHVLYMYV